jgi:hypothetical protein
MICKKCKRNKVKDLETPQVEIKRCRVKGCKNTYPSRFINLCYTCQISKKYCLVCGLPLIEEDNKNA